MKKRGKGIKMEGCGRERRERLRERKRGDCERVERQRGGMKGADRERREGERKRESSYLSY